MVKQDYIMRLISELIRAILKMVFKVDKENEDKMDFGNQQTADKYEKLLDMINEGKINEAENLLVEGLDAKDLKQYQMALMFYSDLNNRDDDFLEQYDYSRQEISDGIKYVSQMYGYENLTALFLNN